MNGPLGDDILEIVHLPGHTPGSIGILSHKLKTLCTGDMLFSTAPMLDSIPGQGTVWKFLVYKDTRHNKKNTSAL